MPTDCIYYDYGVFADIPCNILNFEYKGLGGCVSEQHIQIITKPIQPDTLTDYCHTELKSDKSKWDSAIAFMAIDIADNDGEDNTRTDDNTDTGNINNTIDASGHEKDIQVRSND